MIEFQIARTWRLTSLFASLLALAGCETISVTEVTAIVIAPTITTQPAAVAITRGNGTTLRVVASGSRPITFQWFHNGVVVSGATADSLRIAPAVDADSGEYHVRVSNAQGSVTSVKVAVTVSAPVPAGVWRQDGGAGATSGAAYASSAADVSAVYVTNGGVFTVTSPVIEKSGASSDALASRDRGQNAAVLSATGSRIHLIGGTISSAGIGATGVFATGSGSVITSSGTSIATVGTAAPLVGASDGASVVISGGILNASASEAVTVSAPTAGASPVAVTIGGGAQVSSGTGTLLSVVNGAIATLTLDSVTVSGAASVDSGSVATVALQHSAMWSGAMRGGAVTLDGASRWSVTANSAVTVLGNPAISADTITNVIGNGFAVTYDAALADNASLAGRTYSLLLGGRLTPR